MTPKELALEVHDLLELLKFRVIDGESFKTRLKELVNKV